MIGHPLRQFWLIWSSPYAQNAETFHGFGKFDVVADTIRNFCGYGSLCLWCKYFLVEFYMAPCPTRAWDWFNTRYPISNPNLYFHIPNPPPLTQTSWYGLFLPLLDTYHCLDSWKLLHNRASLMCPSITRGQPNVSIPSRKTQLQTYKNLIYLFTKILN